MSFQAPLFLAGLAVIPIALAALWFSRRKPSKYVIRFPAAATLAAVAPKHGRVRKHLPPALLMLALAGMAIALARPEATVAVPVERASVMLVTDTSGSMNAVDVQPTGWPRPSRPPTGSSRTCRSSCRSGSWPSPTARTRCCARPRTA